MKNKTAAHSGLTPYRATRRLMFVALLAAACASAPAAEKVGVAGLSAAQIVERHIAARGGHSTWQALQTIVATGRLEAGTGDSAARAALIARKGLGAHARRGNADTASQPAAAAAQVELPFRLEMKRPHKSRLEVDFAGRTAVQVFDGQNGWKLRPFLGRDAAEPFTAAETKTEEARADLEPPLMEYAARGTQLALEGTEQVSGRPAYKLKLTMKDHETQHVWIDTQNFLDVKVEGVPRRVDGKMKAVWVYQRDFRTVQGVMVPYLYETATEGGTQTHKMVIEKLEVNRSLDDARFSRPQMLVAANPAGPAATASPRP